MHIKPPHKKHLKKYCYPSTFSYLQS